MWRAPRVLFWPAYGLAFEKGDSDLGQWTQQLLDEFLTNPAVYLSELIGVTVLAWLSWHLWRRGKLAGFLRRGQV